MAAKSFLHHLGWKSGKYQLGKENQHATRHYNKKNPVMEGSYRKQGDHGDEPPSKKRKTDEFDDDDGLWDDSQEFTQADLDDIDQIQASQVCTGKKESLKPVQPSMSSNPPLAPKASSQPSQVKSSGSFLKPKLSLSSSSSNGSHRIVDTSSHSNNNSVHSNSTSHSSHSSYPDSISGYSSNSSVSLKSGSSGEMVAGQIRQRSLSRGLSSDSFDISTMMQSSTTSELTKFKQECASLQLQFDKMKEEVYVKDGEIQLLRDNLKRKDTELDSLKAEKISQIYTQNLQQTEKEKTLQGELTRVQTQLQFKDQEQRELANKVKELENQLRDARNLPSTSQSFASTQSVSPKPKHVIVEARSPRPKRSGEDDRSGISGFPSTQSFMSAEVSPSKREPETRTQGKPANEEQRHTAVESKCCKLRQRRQRQCLQLSDNQHKSPSGHHLVSRMVDVQPGLSGAMSERGIVGLLNTPSVVSCLNTIQFSRDKDTSLLSPAKSQRFADFHSLVKNVDRTEISSLVPVEHYNLAIQGLRQLLQPELRGETVSLEPQTGKPTGNQQYINSSVLILPLINDYLKNYTEMLDANLEISSVSTTTASTSATTTSASSSSNSFDISSESPTGSVGLFLRTVAGFANDLESLCIAALHTLHELLVCEKVREVLMHTEPGHTVEADMETEDAESQSSRLSTSSSEQTPIPLQYIYKLNILYKLLKLSNPGTGKSQLREIRVVTLCLKVLTTLATHADSQQINSLMPVLTDESLQNCIEHTTSSSLVIHGLELFKALTKTNEVVSSLCSNTTGCVLLSVYSVVSAPRWINWPPHTKVHIAKLIIDSLLVLCSSHKGSFTLLLESDCQCSVQVVKSIVLLLHSVQKVYKAESDSQTDCSSLLTGTTSTPAFTSDWFSSNLTGSGSNSTGSNSSTYQSPKHSEILATSLTVLQTGLQLLHLILQYNSGFMDRHLAVQHKYVEVVCACSHIIKPLDNCENELNAIQDLWDFNQDDSELSQDSESEDNNSMDQT